VPPAPSARTRTDRPGRRPGRCPGSCANAALSTAMWSAAVLEPAFPLRSMAESGSPVPSWPWSRKVSKGWKPKPFLNVGAACSLSECAVTRVASMSMTTGCPARAAWSGACSPAAAHTRARAAARAASIASRAWPASAARASTSRDTRRVRGHRAEHARLGAQHRHVGQAVPPTARARARSVTILPGSCRARGLRHPARAWDRPRPRPETRTVSTNDTAPACDTTFVAAVSIWTRGYNPIFFTLKVLQAMRTRLLDISDSRWPGALFS